MKKIEIFNLRVLRNNEHLQFLTEFRNLVIKSQPTELGIDDLFTEFESLFQSEEQAMRTEQGSILSQEIAAVDQQRDNTWYAMYTRIKNTLISPIDSEAESARMLIRVFDMYGDFRQLNYNEESAAITNLLNDLQKEENEPHLASTGIANWVTVLREQNNRFVELQESRNVQLSSRGSGDVTNIRKQIDPVYASMVEKMNALLTLNQAKPATAVLAEELNERINYYRLTKTIRSGRSKKEKEQGPQENMETA